MNRPFFLAAMAMFACQPALAQTPASLSAAPPSIVAAENFYGDLARQLAAPGTTITSILANPDQDPHLFEASPSVARAMSAARIVIYNGADYDPWMEKLLASAKSRDRRVVVVADLVHKKAGANPHLWYDIPTMAVTAQALSTTLAAADPAGKAAYEQRLTTFLDSLKPIDAKVQAMRGKYAGLPVTATEPVFGTMAAALGLTMRNERFQLAVMNDTEPRTSDTAAFETDLRNHQVRALLYNSQATNTAAARLMRIAEEVGIPVVGVTETEPAGKTYQAWMMDQLMALDAALAKPVP